ncbi:MAG: polyphosphate kinase 1, partial [Myxococcota bacterium]
EELIPELAKQGIRFLRRSTWNDAQAKWVAEYFQAEVLPVLSPLGLDPAHPFPRVLNKSLNFIVSLEGQDAFGRSSGLAVVQAPRALGRLIQIPQEVSGGVYDFVFLSSIIHAHVGELFPGMRPKGCYQFRATRNSELFVDEEEVEDLMLAMEEELYQRHYGDAVRLEVADNCPMEAARYLLKQFGLTERELFQVRGPVNLGRLMMIPGAIDRPDLKDEPFVQRTVHVEWPRKQDIFAQLRMGDVLLHHPFESFSTVIEFFKQASEDPNVLAIKQTVYRTEEDSVLVDSLVNAARAGKEVTAVIELRARFDEERNIHIANRLQEAGAHVVYGVVGYKTHAKMALVVRREAGALKRYVHLGTGNYHPRTARLYTDFGLMTYDQEIGEDVHNMFQQLTGLGRVMEMHHLLHSPFTLHSAILDKIERETQLAAAGKRGHIMAKINSLTEPEVVRALYRASRAGVRIDLIIRGICRLRPGHKGLSESIRVRSIVGRFLEHTRCFYFRNGGREEVWCASADWMSRNLLRRVETCFPILAPRLRERVIHEQFQVYLRDNTKAWELNEDGSYTRLAPPSEALAFSAQDALLEELAAES